MKKTFQKLFVITLILSIFLVQNSTYLILAEPATENQIVLNPAARIVDGSEGSLRIQKSIVQTKNDEFTITLDVDTKSIVNNNASSIVLLIDVSGSMLDYDKINSAKAASREFINELFLNSVNTVNNEIGILGFDDDYVDVFQDLTSDQDKLLKAVEDVQSFNKGTNIQLGLNRAQSMLDNAKKGNNKIIVLLSDGKPNAPSSSDVIGDTIAVANGIKATGVEIYSVFFNLGLSAEEIVDTERVVRGIASNGDYHEATDAGSLANTFKGIADDIIEHTNLWRVIDPMAEFIDWVGFTSTNNPGAKYDNTTKTLSWNLLDKGVTPNAIQDDPDGFIYNYSLSYNIKLNTASANFDFSKTYQTNKTTSLVYHIVDPSSYNDDNKTAYFEVPIVKSATLPTLTVSASDLISYTGGESVSNDPFPHPQFKFSGFLGGDTVDTVRFYLDGRLYDSDNSPHHYEFPFEEKFYLINPVTNIPSDTPSDNDDIGGDYLITVNGVGGGKVIARSTIDPSRAYQITYKTGTLYVRGVTDSTTPTHIIPALTTTPTAAVVAPSVYTSSGTIFTDSTNRVISSSAKVALLSDGILVKETMDNMALRLSQNNKTKDMNYRYLYLDLVDANDGNHVLTANKSVTVYLPYPTGTTSKDDFVIMHLAGVNRHYDYTVADKTADWIIPDKTPVGLAFQTDSFSPFAIAYATATDPDDTTNPGGGTTNPGGSTTNPGGGTTNPGGGTTNPGGGTTNPGGGTTNPGGGTTNPGGGTTNPGGGTTNPGGGTTNPGGGTTNPGGGTTNPGGGTTNPDDDTSKPGDGTTNPDGGANKPGGGTTTPGGGTVSPGGSDSGSDDEYDDVPKMGKVSGIQKLSLITLLIPLILLITLSIKPLYRIVMGDKDED